MPLSIESVLNYPSLKNAKLITGAEYLENEVSGAMVMEALDIDQWGREGLVLLTSYYAFAGKSPDEIQSFFEKAENLRIACIVLKVDRLVNAIPDFFIFCCEKYRIPLIQIGKDTTYEKVMNDILITLTNWNAYLLKEYYQIHQHFLQAMMNQSSISEILYNLKQLINIPISLAENVEGKVFGTDEEFNDFQVQSAEDYTELNSREFVHLDYKQYFVTYSSSKKCKSLAVFIPNLGYEEYELIVHNGESAVSDVDLVAIENAVVAIQTELVKQYALRQDKQSRFNEMASDLLHGRLTMQEDIDETIQYLNLDKEKQYRIIVFDFESLADPLTPSLFTRYTDALLNHSNIEFPEKLYVTRQRKVILIVPAQQTDIQRIKEKLRTILKRLSKNSLYSQIKTYVALSNEVKVKDLPLGYKQAFDTLKFLRLVNDTQLIASYQDIGIYQLFAETGNTESLRRFIPENIWKLKDENIELLKTLRTFIDVNQNYSETADLLYVHPKTVRYRIDKLKEQYHMNFANPEETLHYSIALRLLDLIELNKPTDFVR